MTERTHIARFFAPSLPKDGGEVVLDKLSAHHAHVLRVRKGERVCLFDGGGQQALGEVVESHPHQIVCTVGPAARVAERRPRVELVQAIPKGAKLEDIVRAVSELGVTAIHVATSERTDVKPKAHRLEGQIARLERVAQEACRQCRRADVPVVHAPRPLLDIARQAPEDSARFVFWEESTERLPTPTEKKETIWVVVGPEGGLSKCEVQALLEVGYANVSLGPTTLRTETAATVAVALVMDRYGQDN